MPALIENSPVQPGLLAHIASGFVYGAPGAGSHALGVEVFQHNGSKPAGQLETDTVVPVLADAGATGAQGGDARAGLGISLRSSFASGKRLRAALAFLPALKDGVSREIADEAMSH
jgi:hypothetical protein